MNWLTVSDCATRSFSDQTMLKVVDDGEVKERLDWFLMTMCIRSLSCLYQLECEPHPRRWSNMKDDSVSVSHNDGQGMHQHLVV